MRRPRELNRPTQQFGAFPHSDQPDALASRVGHKSRAVILDLQLQRLRQKLQAHPGFARSRVTGYVVQSFLQDAVNMDADAAID